MIINTAIMTKKELTKLQKFIKENKVQIVEETSAINDVLEGNSKFMKLPRSRRVEVTENTREMCNDLVEQQLATIDITMAINTHHLPSYVVTFVNGDDDFKTHTYKGYRVLIKDGGITSIRYRDGFEVELKTFAESLALEYVKGKGIVKEIN